MIMTPPLRNIALTTHVSLSVGWLGAVLAYLALAVTAITTMQEETFRAAYPMMETIGWSVLVPLSVGALLTGLVQSLGTDWGLFRHYWIVAKLCVTVAATTVLLLHMPAVDRLSHMASEASAPRTTLGALPFQDLLHAVGGLAVLITVTALSVYKPWGKTPYGKRRQLATLTRRQSTQREPVVAIISSHPSVTRNAARMSWKLYAMLGVIGLLLLMLALHIAGGGMKGH